MDAQDYKRIAIQVGDAIKYSISLNEIDRAAQSIFPFSREDFPIESITSVRAKRVYDWTMTLAKQKMNPESRNSLLRKFIKHLVPTDDYESIIELLDSAELIDSSNDKARLFIENGFHRLIVSNCKKLYVDGHYFHAVFEAAKVYHMEVKKKAESTKDGSSLMMEAWNPNKGCLKVTQCVSDTDINVQEGIAFLSAGLMRAIRNPCAHEPAQNWPISEKDCLDILSFISFLLRKLDEAVVYTNRVE